MTNLLNRAECNVEHHLSHVTLTLASTFILVSMSIDRVYAIAKPLSWSTGDTAKFWLILSSWLSAFLLSLPIFTLSTVKWDGPILAEQCVYVDMNSFHWQVYVTVSASIVFIIPAIIIAICYIIIVSIIYKSSNKKLNQGRRNIESSQPTMEHHHFSSYINTSNYLKTIGNKDAQIAQPSTSKCSYNLDDFQRRSIKDKINKTTLYDKIKLEVLRADKKNADDNRKEFDIHPKASHQQQKNTTDTNKRNKLSADNTAAGVYPKAKIKSIKMSFAIVLGEHFFISIYSDLTVKGS
ncbi:hypothetical protein HELRODRAFT_162671 [Helobdella robusta]|uniref:G-protein coupled receptors family 1 profile domain-containing protein n=1 Tax=Helobdella robusta TaxID=6412 RepID=T1ET00_HELRO|nr:hypothetical protein HELRODRAFT_162671 [Helobdella robusta]ESN99176.1 hypothetical protein HELRODRAFT_162671 [Helobdella robusta]